MLWRDWISIHPMLRFNFNDSDYSKRVAKDFNTSYVTVQRLDYCWWTNCKAISIRPMLRFNATESADILKRIEIFQYILCYGSTAIEGFKFGFVFKFQYILCYGSTFTKFFLQINTTKFQYILCYGSTEENNPIISFVKKFQYILCYGST